jgi:hypothetical protein
MVATCQNAFGKNKVSLLNTLAVKCNHKLVESIFRSSFKLLQRKVQVYFWSPLVNFGSQTVATNTMLCHGWEGLVT